MRWGVEFGVWGLEFGVWGLGFGVWGLPLGNGVNEGEVAGRLAEGCVSVCGLWFAV